MLCISRTFWLNPFGAILLTSTLLSFQMIINCTLVIFFVLQDKLQI